MGPREHRSGAFGQVPGVAAGKEHIVCDDAYDLKPLGGQRKRAPLRHDW